jgi:uncharacterized membrane protein YdjX (TVP38/TMEM64 family)
LTPPGRKALLKFAALSLVLIALYFLGRDWDVSVAALREQVSGFPVISGILVLGLVHAFISVAPIGGRDVTKLVGAMLWGWGGSTLAIWMGEILAAAAAFVLARLLGKELLDRLFGPKLSTLYDQLNRAGFRNVLILRVLPITPYRLFNFAAGVTDLRFPPYFLASIIGTLIRTAVMQFLFAAFGDLAADQGWTVGQILIGSLVFSFSMILVFYFWAKRRHKSAE